MGFLLASSYLRVREGKDSGDFVTKVTPHPFFSHSAGAFALESFMSVVHANREDVHDSASGTSASRKGAKKKGGNNQRKETTECFHGRLEVEHLLFATRHQLPFDPWYIEGFAGK